MFEKKTRGEWKEKLSLKRQQKELIYTTRRYKNLNDDQFKCKCSNTFQMFSCMLCNRASNY